MSWQRLNAAIRRGWRALVVAVATVLCLANTASAMRVAPMIAEMTTSGSGATARIEVGNAGTAAMPFETTISRLEMAPDGTITETPADDEFLIFPPQGVVGVGGQQVVRVQWVGPQIEQSQAYYLAVRQIPVDTDPSTAGQAQPSIAVNVLYTMKVLLLVAPPGVQPDVRLVSATPTSILPPYPDIDPSLAPENRPEPEPVPGLRVEVSNEGARYALMSGATWVIEGVETTGQPYSRRFAGNEISQLIGVGFVQPGGGRRVFDVPLGTALDPGQPVSVRFTR